MSSQGSKLYATAPLKAWVHLSRMIEQLVCLEKNPLVAPGRSWSLEVLVHNPLHFMNHRKSVIIWARLSFWEWKSIIYNSPPVGILANFASVWISLRPKEAG